MKHRCSNPNYTGYHLYGGRGITVDPEWASSFVAFARDVGLPPTPKHTLDRIDNSKGYEKGNVRWATPEEQSHNRRTNKLIEYNGVTQPLAKWAKQLGLSYTMLRHRYDKGIVPPDLFAPEHIPTKRPEYMVELDGELVPIKVAVERTGIKRSTLYYRYKKGLKV